jgi:hypothetical protein
MTADFYYKKITLQRVLPPCLDMWAPSELPVMHCHMPSRRQQLLSKISDLKKRLIVIIVLTHCETKKRRKIRSLSDPTMKLSICEAKIMNSFVIFFKILKR